MKKEFSLPPANENDRRVFAYLLKHRRLDRDVLTTFVRLGLIYEDKGYHNAVFVGKDQDGKARHAHKRSTNSQGRSFRMTVEGGDFRYAFNWPGPSAHLLVFEAPIDMLPFISIHRDSGWAKHSYVALCGTSSQPLLGCWSGVRHRPARTHPFGWVRSSGAGQYLHGSSGGAPGRSDSAGQGGKIRQDPRQDHHQPGWGQRQLRTERLFYDPAEGLLTAVVLLPAEFLPPKEIDGQLQERRHIVSVFKLVQDLLEPSQVRGKSRFQVLMSRCRLSIRPGGSPERR